MNTIHETDRPLTCAGAIVNAIEILATHPKDLLVKMTIARLLKIVEQGGCADFDPAVTDGRLTTLMDVVIDG